MSFGRQWRISLQRNVLSTQLYTSRIINYPSLSRVLGRHGIKCLGPTAPWTYNITLSFGTEYTVSLWIHRTTDNSTPSIRPCTIYNHEWNRAFPQLDHACPFSACSYAETWKSTKWRVKWALTGEHGIVYTHKHFMYVYSVVRVDVSMSAVCSCKWKIL